ncbi:MAG: hypothetical protein HYU78_01245 [Rhodocyclales bacterium]|nr:hypothetical protein [Rhodocyclales bacterium]
MAYRRYRKKRSMAGEMLADTSHIANRLSWKGAAVFGIVLFAVFYWLLPMWLRHQFDSLLQGNMFRPMIAVVLGKRIHWIQWAGIALGLVCGFYALRNFFVARRLGTDAERNVGFLGRVLARWLD